MDLATAEVAKRLGVDPSRVRQMLRSGELQGHRIGGRWLVSSGHVARMESQRRLPGRPLAPRRAWGLLYLLEGRMPTDLSPVARSQVRAVLKRVAGGDADRWRAALRARQFVLHARAHPSAVGRILRDERVVPTGAAAASRLGVDLVAVEDKPEVYVRADDWAGLADEYSVRDEGVDSNIVVRIPRATWPFVDGELFKAAVAADLLEYAEPRAVASGVNALNEMALRTGRGR